MLGASDTLRKFSRVMNTDVLKGATKLSGFLAGNLAGAILNIPRFVGKAILSLGKLALVLGTSLVAAATAAGGALLFLAERSAEAIDAMRVQAVKLGISTKFFGTLAIAADGAGVSMDTATAAITKVTRAVSDAAIKGGPAADALKEIGLSAYQLIRLSPDQQFLKIAEAMGGVANQSDKIRIAVALFGKAGAEILPLFSENMQEASKWAKILNVEVSDFDAAQIDAAGDNVGLLKKAFEGVGNYIATNLAPIITGVTDEILNFIVVQGGVAAIVERVMIGAAAIAVESLNRIGEAAQNAASFAGGLGLDSNSPKNAIEAASSGLADLTRGIFYLGRLFTAVWATFKTAAYASLIGAVGLVKLLIDAANKLPLVNIDTTGINAAVDEISKDLEDAANDASIAWFDVFGGADFYRTTENAAQAVQGVGNKVAEIADTGVKFVAVGFDDWAKLLANLGLKDIEAILDRISRKVDETTSKITSDTAASYFNRIRGDGPSDKIFNITDKTVKQQETFADEMTRIWARTADSISDSLASALLNGENAFKSLANVAKSVAEQILSAFINKAFISPIIGAITGEGGGGGILSIFGRSSSGVAPSSSLSGIASSMSGASSDAPPVQIVFKGDVYGMEDFNKKVKEGVLRSRKEIEQMADSRISSNFARKPAYAVGR